MLRYLFANLIDEEIKRDATFRENLTTHSKSGMQRRENMPSPIDLPPVNSREPQSFGPEDDAVITPRATEGTSLPSITTSGLSIGVATPLTNGSTHNTVMQNPLPATVEESSDLEKRLSQQSQSRSSTEKSGDYFSSSSQGRSPVDESDKGPITPGDTSLDAAANSSTDEKSKESNSLFGKKFRMNFPKKLGRSSTEAKPAIVDEKSEESDKSEDKEEKPVQDSLLRSIQMIRHDYEERIRNSPSRHLPSMITPSPTNETPMLRLPALTAIIIQEERPDSGGVEDLYRGTVESVGADADLVEKAAPAWLGDLLLRNQMQAKEIPKVSFVLLPFQDLLPSIASEDGNSRLNANRMLRAKKILSYVAERVEPQSSAPSPETLRPEEYLELYCHNQVGASPHFAHEECGSTMKPC